MRTRNQRTKRNQWRGSRGDKGEPVAPHFFASRNTLCRYPALVSDVASRGRWNDHQFKDFAMLPLLSHGNCCSLGTFNRSFLLCLSASADGHVAIWGNCSPPPQIWFLPPQTCRQFSFLWQVVILPVTLNISYMYIGILLLSYQIGPSNASISSIIAY